MRHPLYLVEQGSRLTKKGRRLSVVKDNEVITQVALVQVSQAIVFGNVSITTPALQLLLREGIEVVLLSRTGRFYGRLIGEQNGNGALRVAQLQRSQEPDFALRTARQFVTGKLHNLRVLLQRYARRAASTSNHWEAASLTRAVDEVGAMLPRINTCQTINSLSGVEGRGTAAYFRVWKELLKPPWRFERRIRRPPPDPVNILLSFGYTLLTQNIWGAVLTAGLDPYVGFLHQLNYNRPSLPLDLMEEFRPVIVDSVVLRCLNNEILTPDHFVPGDQEERPLVLTDEGMRRFIREMEARFDQDFKDARTGRRISYRRLFLNQVYHLSRIITGAEKGPYRPFLIR
ncbi:MAG: CRISPR-associated endonuclease Cas1 [Caldilineaceae bacterium SB0661_bin_32]|uniref:CRISPR-associated endonuclease Cas1 n=1 Tax=Caldilineaceae bacterium SB0661_bin_32 TaxID=2605255 RepID=A0A6B1D7V0_9CHLR|nr:CRISPR-associated endonuclease Cas1 [Caldilineaceae bacterium SB0661_bin_32]